jgi:hypothetical protein
LRGHGIHTFGRRFFDGEKVKIFCLRARPINALIKANIEFMGWVIAGKILRCDPSPISPRMHAHDRAFLYHARFAYKKEICCPRGNHTLLG